MRNQMDEQTKRKRWIERILKDTEFLRTTSNPIYRRIRELLVARSIDPMSVLVANIMREDTSVESGFIVTMDKRVYEFELDWRGRTCEEAVFAVWRDLTDTYHTRAFREPVSVALSMTLSEAGRE
jgi:hypothetical protein